MTTHAPPQADADYLTAALRKSGALDGGRVAAATVVHTFPTLLSKFHRLKLDYEGTDDAPRHLYLKSGLPGSAGAAWDSGRREVAIYDSRTGDAAQTCYHAASTLTSRRKAPGICCSRT